MGKFVKKILRPGILVAIVLTAFLLWNKWQTMPEPVPPVEEREEMESWRQSFSESDLDLLARVVRAEAEGEPYDGQVAVAAVILNRVNHPEFPNTIPAVVYEPLA
ncbi:MAG: hypothetical protein GX971_10955, partial [Firmicutes bacterium]|nr:hypothetical protein [Bacillota bacterium]